MPPGNLNFVSESKISCHRNVIFRINNSHPVTHFLLMTRFFLPVTLVICSLLALVAATRGYVPALQSEIALQTLRIILWVASIALCASILAVLLRANFKRRSGHTPPRLLIDVFTVSVWIASLSTMAVVELGISPSAAFATSGALIAVIGFAVRSLVADLFYGITMAIERPFEIGNWIELNDGIVGRVEEMTWRAVKIVTKDNVRVVVPVCRQNLSDTWRADLRDASAHQGE